MSAMNTVVLTTLAVVRPWDSSRATTFLQHCSAWAQMSPSTSLPVAGSSGIWPERKKMSPTRMPWL